MTNGILLYECPVLPCSRSTVFPFYRVPAPPFWWVLKFKVFALLGQWVKRFASSPSGWSSFMSFWFSSSFGVPLATVLSRPFSFDPGVLLPFYSSLLFAWRRLNGSFPTSHNSLAVGVGSPLPCTPVVGVSTWSYYLYLLSENMAQPHCVDKFSFTFGPLDWPATWRSLSFFDVDRHVIDLNCAELC